jgi:hypothetical protein
LATYSAVAELAAKSQRRDEERDMYTGDIVIHIDEDLDNDRIRDLEGQIGDEHGVYSAYMYQKTRDLMVVDFDATEVRPSRIVESVRGGWLHAEMIGL